MTNKRKPTLLFQSSSDVSARLELKVDADLLDFTGHFPSFALLPGVTQIDWVMYYAKQAFGLPYVFAGMEVLKFQEPILPGSTVWLDLIWDPERCKLQFKYHYQDKVFSSGKIKLGAE